jgi:hypothetical protein
MPPAKTMKNNSRPIIILLVLAMISCQTSNGDKGVSESTVELNNYEIIEELPSETFNKAQILYYAHYTDSVYSEKALSKVLVDIYGKAKHKDYFDNFNSPTVIGVYLFTSKETAQKDKSSWIAMLSKGPSDQSPRLSYNSLKISGLQGLNDSVKSKDEIYYENLNQYLQERGLQLCSFAERLGQMEDECIRLADKKYPNFGIEHSDYSFQLMKERRKEIASTYNLVDSIFGSVAVFSMTYCK